MDHSEAVVLLLLLFFSPPLHHGDVVALNLFDFSVNIGARVIRNFVMKMSFILPLASHASVCFFTNLDPVESQTFLSDLIQLKVKS